MQMPAKTGCAHCARLSRKSASCGDGLVTCLRTASNCWSASHGSRALLRKPSKMLRVRAVRTPLQPPPRPLAPPPSRYHAHQCRCHAHRQSAGTGAQCGVGGYGVRALRTIRKVQDFPWCGAKPRRTYAPVHRPGVTRLVILGVSYEPRNRGDITLIPPGRLRSSGTSTGGGCQRLVFFSACNPSLRRRCRLGTETTSFSG